MKQEEKDYIEAHFPKDDKELRRYRPEGAWRLFGWGILYFVPLIGWIFMIYCAASNKRIARRSFARAMIIIVVVLTAIAVISALAGYYGWWGSAA